MLERFDPVLRIICAALAALLVYQLSRFALAKSPLKDLSIPSTLGSASAPSLPTSTQGTNSAVRQQSGKLETNLPPAIQARVERITQSEILGPVIRPQPMALLGIAGTDALLRAPRGETGWVKEGGELGGVKLLRLGTNRVLIEHDGQKKELMLFSGFGGETLLPKGKDNSK